MEMRAFGLSEFAGKYNVIGVEFAYLKSTKCRHTDHKKNTGIGVSDEPYGGRVL